MTLEERLDQLEHRLAALERSLRPERHVDAPAPRAAPAAPVPAPFAAPPTPLLTTTPRAAAPPTAPPTARATPAPLGTEQWVGQRGLLAVGVALLVLAAAYLLKLAIDRGWISPALRCVGAGVAGIAVGTIGWRLYQRGLKTYGASLIGAGAAIIYLGLWAAARLYALVPPGIGIAGLAIVALALAALAYRLDIEALGATAALGALFAPIVVGSESPDANALLIYLGVIGLTLGAAGALRRWRIATDLVVLTYFLLALLAADQAAPGLVLAYALAGGSAGLALRTRWQEIGFVAFVGAWTLLDGMAGRSGTPWLVIAGALVLAVPIWWHAFDSPTIWPDPGVVQSRERWSRKESFYFYLTPLLAGLTINAVFPQLNAWGAGTIPLMVAVPYVIAGFSRVRVTFAVAGTSALAIAALAEWSGLGAGGALLGLSVAWASLDHVLRRTDGRWYSLLALAAALVHLFGVDLARRGNGAAFVDQWALLAWLAIVLIVAMAMGLWHVMAKDAAAPATTRRSAPYGSELFQETFLKAGATLQPWIPAVLWSLAGALLFGVVTGELLRFINQQHLNTNVAQLAGGLSVSAWWTVFAGGLVFFGFYRRLSQVRVAGLVVAGFALAKVVLSDLSRLDALYRVGSVFILAVVSLLIAYLYNRLAKSDSDDKAGDAAGTRRDS